MDGFIRFYRFNIATNLYIVLLVVGCALSTENPTFKNYDQREWVVRVVGGTRTASLIALRSGYKNLGPVMGFNDTYLWHVDERQVWKRNNNRIIKHPSSNPKIIWADEQKNLQRHKRDFINDFKSEKKLIREKRLFGIHYDEDDIERESNIQRMFNDELWNEEWYLQDTRMNRNLPKLDLNVLPLYQLGITGRGVKIAVLDDGLEYTHEDLRNNYDSTISYDVNRGNTDPIPRYEITGVNGHGTRCAGEIAMEANNHKCGVGIAFESSIGGIKLLDGIVNDRVEGEALSYRQDLIDIYTASWGPADDGKSLEAPGRLATEALERGINEGRGGKGNIYVWASGNGGTKEDDCGCDGYVGSIYTIAVGSASQTGKFPWYGERCPATIATTYSSGAYYDQMIATTDLNNECTTRHTGTSASAPLAAGILALALQVNKELTWRDIQHLIATTSEYTPLRNNPGWRKNAAGFWFNSRFGFGLMNAYELVTAAYNWTRVPDKNEYRVKAQYREPRTLVYGEPTTLIFNVVAYPDGNVTVEYLEHVQVEITINYTNRGALQMYLTSPSGTKIEILSPRKFDKSTEGFKNWKFMTLATWGENAKGTWTLDITDVLGPKTNNGTIRDITLIIHGTKYPPNYHLNGGSIDHNDFNRRRKMDDIEIIGVDKNVGRDDKKSIYAVNNRTRKLPKHNRLLLLDWLQSLLFS